MRADQLQTGDNVFKTLLAQIKQQLSERTEMPFGHTQPKQWCLG